MGKWLNRIRAAGAASNEFAEMQVGTAATSVGCVSESEGASEPLSPTARGILEGKVVDVADSPHATGAPWEEWVERGQAIMVTDLPPTPFELRRGVYVDDARRLLEDLHRDLRLGPEGPRAVTGEVQVDIVALEMRIAARRAGQRGKE